MINQQRPKKQFLNTEEKFCYGDEIIIKQSEIYRSR